MKQSFSEYRFLVTELAKHFRVKRDDVFTEMPNCIRRRLNGRRLFDSKEGKEFLRLEIEKRIINEGTHYFINSPELSEYLINLGTEHHEGPVLEILRDNSNYGVIYTPGLVGVSVAFGFLIYNDGVGNLVAGASNGPGLRCGPQMSWPVSTLGKMEDVPRWAALLFGVAIYVDCFPHALKDGCPDIEMHPPLDHYKAKGARFTSVASVPEIVIDHSSPTPHYRRGHYRHLKSAVFTRKRWQTVWVKSAHVKGKTKTIEDEGRIEEAV